MLGAVRQYVADCSDLFDMAVALAVASDKLYEGVCAAAKRVSETEGRYQLTRKMKKTLSEKPKFHNKSFHKILGGF